MKHVLSFTLIMLLSFTVFSQSTDTLNIIIKGKKEGYWIHKNFFKTRIKSEGFYKKNVKNGFWKEYSKKMPTVFQGNYIDGLRDGSWYIISTRNDTKLDLQKYHKGRMVGGATLSW
ncbi:MAG: antitoxin component YwqK of YwqJK toxin-antitoxin module [Glaciecola sp.]|jgi:antitoxin component YwqK of YwqJK toxin-antitoxin module